MADYNSDRTGSNIDLTLDKVDALDEKVQPTATGVSVTGKVGINTANPQRTLDVQSDSGDADARIYAKGTTSSDDAVLYLGIAGTTATNRINFGDANDADRGRIIYDHSGDYMSFTTAGSERARIDSSGNLLVGTTSSPTGSGQIVANNGIYLGGTDAVNKLDDYEEGTWTPVFSSTSATITQGILRGSYTKIGDLVTASAYIQITSIAGTLTNTIKLTGLPFTYKDRDGHSGAFGVEQFSSRPTIFMNNIGDNYVTMYKAGTTTEMKASDINVGYYLMSISYTA